MFGCNPRDYLLKVELARCCNGIATVYLAQCLPTREHIALKKYEIDKTSNKDDIRYAQIRDELLAMRYFNHPNLHTFHTAYVHGNEMYLVSTLMCFGSCKDTIRNCFPTGLPEIFVALIMRDVLSGLEYMHRRGYIHRAIRASHILLSQTKAVLSGFRECTPLMLHGKRRAALHELALFSTSSLNWLAPEVLEQNLHGYTEKSDVYSLGITCCELANGVEPFVDAQPTFMFTEKIRGNVPTLLDRTTCPASEDVLELAPQADNASTLAARAQMIYSQRIFSEEFHQFAEICMEKRPASRWTTMQLLSHAFFKQCRHTSMLDQLQNYGIEVADYSQLRDKSLEVCEDFDELQIADSENWHWDF